MGRSTAAKEKYLRSTNENYVLESGVIQDTIYRVVRTLGVTNVKEIRQFSSYQEMQDYCDLHQDSSLDVSLYYRVRFKSRRVYG